MLEHDNIVKAFEYGENDSEYFIVMEYLQDADYFQLKLEEVY